MPRRVTPLSGVPAGEVPLHAVPQGVRDVVQAGIDDSACQDSAIWLESLPDDVESELVQARKPRSVSPGESAARQVEPIGRPRHTQVSARLTSRPSAGVTARIR
jgi:hypothetical protein